MRWLIERTERSKHKAQQPMEEERRISVPSPPIPEIIIEEGHPLRLYPGFSEFVKEWNEHASSCTRLDLQADIQSAQLETGKLEPQVYNLESDVEECRTAQRNQRATYKIQPAVPKEIQKKTIRNLRREQEEANRKFQQKERDRKTVQARLETATINLAQLDDQFSYELDEKEVQFYIVERLRKNLDAYDDFLLRYFARKGITRKNDLEDALNRMNFDCINLAMYYDGLPNIKIDFKPIWEATYKATARQLDKREIIKHK